MLTYDMEKNRGLPLYEYLYSCIRQDIIQGRILPGEKLPSKRSLARNHGVSVITAEHSYEQLLEEGYITAVEKRGYFVENIEAIGGRAVHMDEKNQKEPADAEADTKASDRLSGEAGRPVYLTSQEESGTSGRGLSEASSGRGGVTDLTSGRLSYTGFPFNIWGRLMKNSLLDEEGTFFQSPESTGVLPLRNAIARHLREFRGLTVKAENIIVGAGTEYLYGILVQLLGRSSMIAVEDPGHLKISRIYETNGIKVVHIPVDQQGFSVDSLGNNRVSAVHISPAHHFPTGVIMSAGRRHRLINWGREHGSYIIEDEYDSEFNFSGRAVPAMASLDPEIIIYMNTFSRSLSPSVRIAYMVLPEELMKRYRRRLDFYSGTVSSTDQYTLAAFIEGGYYERHLARMKNFYSKRRKNIINILSSVAGLTVMGTDAGLHLTVKVENWDKNRSLTDELLDRGVRLNEVALYCYRPQPAFDDCLVVSYSSAGPEEIQQLADCLKELISSTEAGPAGVCKKTH